MGAHLKSRLITPDDGQDILELNQRVNEQRGYVVNRSISHWAWEYWDNPTGITCSFIAEDNNNIVGHSGLLPAWMNIAGKKILGAQSVDTMTHPAYRKQGVYTSLAEECYTYAASQGIELLYRFPNAQSYPLALKLGWSDLGRLPCLLKTLNPKSIIRSGLINLPHLLKTASPRTIVQKGTVSRIVTAIAERYTPFLLKSRRSSRASEAVGHVRIERIQSFDARFDDLWSKVKNGFPISVWRDSEYLNWRYHSHPKEQYTVLAAEEDCVLVGFIVVKCHFGEINTGYIVDFLSFTEKEGAASLLVSAGIDYLKGQGMDTAMCHIFEHSPSYYLFEAHGFREYGEGLRFMARPSTPDLASGSFLERRQWHLMEGDVDTF